MPLSPENLQPSALEKHSAQRLNFMLRLASNRLEMLLSPDSPHHADDAERQRIQAMDPNARLNLQRETMNAIKAVRAEFRRRLGDDRQA